ncbi:MAG TPA: hypothetical protein VKU60_02150 [Chloroflexota bacterium]|nr:hypothetical protein [Chloroflexota bacterium]
MTSAGLTLQTKSDLDALKQTGDAAGLAEKVTDFSLLRQAQTELTIHCAGGYQCQ